LRFDRREEVRVERHDVLEPVFLRETSSDVQA
jgi:hypothetical protein